MPVHERLSMVVSLNLIGLALYFVIDLPARTLTLGLFGSPLVITASARLLMVVLLGGLAFTGAGAVVHSHPEKRVGYTVPFWVNAMLLVVLATLILARLGGPLAWAIGLLATGVLLWFTILAEYTVIEPSKMRFNLAQLWSQGMSYALMLAYAVLVYQDQIEVGLSLISLSLIGGLLASSIFKLHAPPDKQIGLFSLLVGLGIGQITWVLTYWPISPTGAALLTLLSFYVLSGLISTHFDQNLSKRTLIEYALVSGAGLGLFSVLGVF